MKKNKIDRRIKYTKMVLKKSLLHILETKDIGEISISELCRHADINRNTFYTHYASPFELLEEIENEMVVEVLQEIKNEQSDEILILNVCQKIFSMRNLNKVVYLKSDNRRFMEKIFAPVREERLKMWKKIALNKSNWYIEHIYSFTQNGIMAIIDEWIKKDYKDPPEKIAKFISSTSELIVKSLRQN